MRRGDLWQQALANARAVVDDVGPGDDVALFAFDSDVRRLAAFDDPASADPVRQVRHLHAQLAKLAPTWAATDVGQALIRAADELNRAGAAEKPDAPDVYRESRTSLTLEAGGRAELTIVCDFEPDKLVVDPDAIVLQLERDQAVADL